tara:strand:- start:908 stop:1300 length:393 start_codon:yes stop_codon:yes gene_type:complete
MSIKQTITRILNEEVHIVDPTQVGQHQADMSYKKAAYYLKQNPEGYLIHDMMSDTTFVFITLDGQYGWFTGEGGKILPWDWSTELSNMKKEDPTCDPRNGWHYFTADEEQASHQGEELWTACRKGHFDEA